MLLQLTCRAIFRNLLKVDSSWSDDRLEGGSLHLPSDASPGIKSWLFLAQCGALGESLPSLKLQFLTSKLKGLLKSSTNMHGVPTWFKPQLACLPLLPSTPCLVEAHQTKVLLAFKLDAQAAWLSSL